MSHSHASQRRARNISTVVFLLGLAALIFTQDWWPGIMLVFGLSIATRQLLLGQTYDTFVSLLVFVGTFLTVHFDMSWRIFLPILFTLGAIYILVREFFESEALTEEEKEDDVTHEIEENRK
ncbi:MAG: hypothetical protein KGJ02_06785 [Verrucomicrobiota bacterium]|nr:hypothetical protein [Verrucomicrobiota bacterium]